MTDNRTQAQRFWPKVNKAGPVPEYRPDLGHCWIWTAAKYANGYGISWWTPRRLLAHRVAYELAEKPIPDGMELDHLCRVRSCVNPSHLEPVTPRDNRLRGEGITAANARKTHCKRGHEFTPENTRLRIRGGAESRECKTCRQEARHRNHENSPPGG